MNLKKEPARFSTVTFTILTLSVSLMAQTALPAAEAERKPVVFEVLLPADASLEVEGSKTQSTGDKRRFESPPVPTGKSYSYRLKVTWNGNTITRKVSVTPDQVTTIDLRDELEHPKPAATVEPKTEARVEPKPEVQTKSEPKPEPKDEAKGGPDTLPQADAQVQPKVESKPAVKTGPMPEPQANSTTKSTPGDESEPKTPPTSEPKPEAKTEKQPPTEPKTEVKVEPKEEPKAEAKVEPKPEPKAETKPEPKVEAKPEPKTEPKPEPKVELKPEPSVQPKVEPKAPAGLESVLVLGLPSAVVLKPGEVTYVVVKVSKKDATPLTAEPAVAVSGAADDKVKIVPWTVSDFSAKQDVYAKGYAVQVTGDAGDGERTFKCLVTVGADKTEGSLKITVQKNEPSKEPGAAKAEVKP